MSVITIDCDYVAPKFAASYLLVDQGRACFIETNTTHAVPRLLAALKEQHLRPDQVEYIIITHVHLDHAGGASALMEACPNAKLLAHPRAVPHVIDPSKLIRSARHVYGDRVFEELYGQIDPIPSGRVRAVEDGEEVSFGSRTLRFLHTRGHANHHLCVLDVMESTIFTGDTFGLAYPAIQDKGVFIIPSTSPTDFDPDEARKSIERVLNSGAKRVFLTHFGEVRELAEAARQLHEHIDFSERVLNEATALAEPDDALVPFCEKRLIGHFQQAIRKRGLDFEKAWKLLEFDVKINAGGIAFVAAKRRKAAAS